jgi:GLPGLI family protein
MNKLVAFVVLMGLSLMNTDVFAQRKLTEGSITYEISINSSDSNPKIAEMFDGAISVVYLKGFLSKSEMISSLGVQSTIANGKTGVVNILKEYGDQKYMITLTTADWKDANSKYEDIKFTYLEEYKTIKGYNCQKAVGNLSDGSFFSVYFTKELKPENYEFQYANKTLPGLALEYESTMGNLKVVYKATQISFNPVPLSKFDLPKSGFRVLTYEESKKLGGN